MKKLYTKIAAGTASAILLGGMFASSVLASTTGDSTITGNGAKSTNTITVVSTTNCNVSQSNNTNVVADVSSSASTGGNQANSNTGGDVSVSTGDAVASSSVTVTGGDNTAVNPCCGCTLGVDPALDPTISGNGKGSKNTVTVVTTQSTKINQKGTTGVLASVSAKAKTGKNKANSNTGPGSVSVTSGSSTSASAVSVAGGSNSI